MNWFQNVAAIFLIVVLAVIGWIWGFLPVGMNYDAIPTLVNGITSSTSLILGFCGVIIGIMFREPRQKSTNRVSTGHFVFFLIMLIIPVSILWWTYSTLAFGAYLVSVKCGLSNLILALYIFASLIIYVIKETDLDVNRRAVQQHE